jgi:hypothetical protein
MQYEFSDQEMQIIIGGLGEMPMKVALPVLQTINLQRETKRALETPSAPSEALNSYGA